MKLEETEWEISTNSMVLYHKKCITPQKRYHSHYKVRETVGWICGGCEELIPDYIVFQWKLLNE